MIRLLLSLLRQGAEILIGREIAARAARRAAEALFLFSAVAVFATAALIFFYVFAYHRLAEALDADSAAAILCGANLLLIALVLIGRTIARSSRRRSGAARSAAGVSNADAALALGLGLERKLREKAPEVALVAAIVGLAIGARPELLDLLKPRAKRDAPRAKKGS